MKLNKIVFPIALIIILIWTLSPIYWIFLIAFRPDYENYQFPPKLLPHFPPYLYNLFHGTAIEEQRTQTEIGVFSFMPYVNSVIIAASTTIISVAIACLAGYSLSRFKFRGRNGIGLWILSFRVIPPAAIILPYFIMMNRLKLIDTHPVLIFTYLIFNIPFAVWMMRGYFNDLPVDMEEAAMVDGCTRMQSFVKILLPLSLPGMVATALFCFLFSWNEFMFAFILTKMNAKTFPVMLGGFIEAKGIYWGRMAMASLIGFIPPIILAMALQKHLVRGLTLGAMKGT